MQKNVKLIVSPFNPNMEVVDKMVMTIHVPYSNEEVTIRFNPNIQDYKENQYQPGVKVRQFTVSSTTDQTKTAKFDFKQNNVHKIKIEGTLYNIKLMTIGKENIQGQDFPFFEFFVTCD
jgi:ribosomal protein S10